MTDPKADARALAYLTGALTGGDRPDAVGRKFDAQGNPLICRGNTTLCHVDPASDAFDALVEAQETLKAGPHASGFTFLPHDSFHMTIFEGVIDYNRRDTRWPAHLPLDAEIETVTQDFAGRLTGLSLPARLLARPTGIFGGFSVRMTGADEEHEGTLRETRDRLQAATDLVRPDHTDYQFHITLAYNLRWFLRQEAEEINALSSEVGKRLMARMPRVGLGPVEFCRFETMHHFETLQTVE